MKALEPMMKHGFSGFDALIGTRIDHLEVGKAVVSIVVEEKHCNPMGTLHGGALLSLADSAAGLACSWDGLSPTAEGKLSFTAPCLLGDRVRVQGIELRHGRTLRTCEVRAWNQEDKLVAAGIYTYVAPREEG